MSLQESPVPWNVVISDNGSTDGTVALAQSYADRLPGLVIIDSSAQAGPGYARNAGAAATTAPLLIFCDADDEAAPGWLAAMIHALEQEHFVAGRFESTKLNDPRVLRSRPLQQSDGLQESPFGPGLPHAGAGNLGVRRGAFFSVGGFDPEVGCLEDTDLCWRIQLTGVRLVFAPDAVMHVRLRSSWLGMWGQGVAYGTASALLEQRYAPVTPIASAVDLLALDPSMTPVAPRSTMRKPGASRRATLFALVRTARTPGALLWTLGWHVGHRQWHPTRPVPPVSATRSRSADAA